MTAMSPLLRPGTREEFDAEAARLKSAVRKEYGKVITETYPSLTIRQALDVWAMARGGNGTREAARELEQLSSSYDVDSPKDFARWLPVQGHTLELIEYEILLLPVTLRLADGTAGWVFQLTGQPGYAAAIAEYTARLQEAGVLFFLNAPEAVMKELGYWIRSWRHDFRKAGALSSSRPPAGSTGQRKG